MDGADLEEQETFETGVGVVEPVEEDEAEAGSCTNLRSCFSPGLLKWDVLGHDTCMAFVLQQLDGPDAAHHLGSMTDTCASLCRLTFWGSPRTGNLHLVQRVTTEGLANVLGLRQFDDIFAIPYRDLQHSQQVLCGSLCSGCPWMHACMHACMQRSPAGGPLLACRGALHEDSICKGSHCMHARCAALHERRIRTRSHASLHA